VQNPSAVANCTSEQTDKPLAIGIIAVNIATLVTATGDVPNGTGVFETERA
jgi:hypothetical protein